MRGRGRGQSGTVFNGVECADFEKVFSKTEMRQMGYEGRQYIFGKLNERDRKNGGKRPGRGEQGPITVSQALTALRTIQEIGARSGTEALQDEDGTAIHDPLPEEPESQDFRSAKGRGGRAGAGFGRGAYGRLGRGGRH